MVVVAVTATVAGATLTAWSTSQKFDEIAGNHADLDTPAVDGCPSQSPDVAQPAAWSRAA
jgi:hypothetical protein